MVYVEGGSYLQGDWRNENDEEYQYTISNNFGDQNMNILRGWNNVLDPQFMGEEAAGQEAVGVTGLDIQNSSAKNDSCPMWRLNDASINVHNVTVSDYWMGKYEVTMEQFYDFVNACNIESEEPAVVSYTVNGVTNTLDEISSYAIICKKAA